MDCCAIFSLVIQIPARLISALAEVSADFADWAPFAKMCCTSNVGRTAVTSIFGQLSFETTKFKMRRGRSAPVCISQKVPRSKLTLYPDTENFFWPRPPEFARRAAIIVNSLASNR